MEIWRSIAENWFTLLQSLGIVASLLFTAETIRADSKARRIENLISITGAHREIWQAVHSHPGLSRVLDLSPDLAKQAITSDERVFVLLVILHLSSVFRAVRAGVLKPPEGMEDDVRTFFSLPIPAAIWNQNKNLQDRDFVQFVETC